MNEQTGQALFAGQLPKDMGDVYDLEDPFYYFYPSDDEEEDWVPSIGTLRG